LYKELSAVLCPLGYAGFWLAKLAMSLPTCKDVRKAQRFAALLEHWQSADWQQLPPVMTSNLPVAIVLHDPANLNCEMKLVPL